MLTAALAGATTAQDKLILDVVSLRPGDSEAAYHAFDAQVTQFEEANPDIDIEKTAMWGHSGGGFASARNAAAPAGTAVAGGETPRSSDPQGGGHTHDRPATRHKQSPKPHADAAGGGA